MGENVEARNVGEITYCINKKLVYKEIFNEIWALIKNKNENKRTTNICRINKTLFATLSSIFNICI